MEIIVTRNQLSLDSKIRNILIQDITVYNFNQEYFILFKECDKVTFRDDDGTENILKNRH